MPLSWGTERHFKPINNLTQTVKHKNLNNRDKQLTAAYIFITFCLKIVAMKP